MAKWLRGYVAKWSPYRSTYRLRPLRPTTFPDALRLFEVSSLQGRVVDLQGLAKVAHELDMQVKSVQYEAQILARQYKQTKL